MRREQSPVVACLRVPLHRDAELAVKGLDGLDRPVLGPCGRREISGDPIERLVMMAVSRRGRAEQSAHRAAYRRAHLSMLEQSRTGVVAADAGPDRKVLHQVTAQRDIEQLHPAADGEHWQIPIERGLQGHQLGAVPVGPHYGRVRPRWLSVAGRVDVGPAGEDQTVQTRDRVGRDAPGWQQHRVAAGGDNGVDVRRGQQDSWDVPGPPAGLLAVGRDANQRSHVSSTRTQPADSVENQPALLLPMGDAAATQGCDEVTAATKGGAVKLLMIAPPGAGKGTQGAVIASHFDIPHIATGDLLREHVARRTELGVAVQRFLDRGELVPDEVVLKMVRDALVEAGAGGFVLDGIPRTMDQARSLYEIAAELAMTADVALYLQVEEAELVRRLLARASLEGRSDDTEQIIRHRLQLYNDVTHPILEWYGERGILVSVNAQRPADQVGRHILTALEVMRQMISESPDMHRRAIDLTGLGVAFGSPPAGA